MGEVRIGTSGWHYPGGRGTWDGVFYPRREDRPRRFDELAFYAERFDTVEINSTFYGQPRAAVSLQWVRRTPRGFEFSVKLFQKFTHPAMAAASHPAGEAAALHASAITRADIDAFKAGVEPLAAANRLGALLAQFPPSFHNTPSSRAYLAWLIDTFADYPVAVELRHRSWSDDEPATRAVLLKGGAAWAQIDEPKFSSSIVQDFGSVPGGAGRHRRTAQPDAADAPSSGAASSGGAFMYLRLHGRNAEHWWDHEAAEDRYNYLYTEEELAPMVERMKAARGRVAKLYLYLNNHFAASAVADAAMVRDMLDEPVGIAMPAELVERYPMLGGRVRVLPRARLL